MTSKQTILLVDNHFILVLLHFLSILLVDSLLIYESKLILTKLVSISSKLLLLRYLQKLVVFGGQSVVSEVLFFVFGHLHELLLLLLLGQCALLLSVL